MSGNQDLKKMIEDQIIKRGGINNNVLNVMQKVDRSKFVFEADAEAAFEDRPLPIGFRQTISQPYMVALMTSELAVKSTDCVLEIGTGSGYQTAILAQLFAKVFSVERIKSLQFHAKRRMNQLDLHNIAMKHGDGWKGWSSKGPFDAIIVTAAASSLPQDLCEQLKEGGRLIIPVGNEQQSLLCIDRVEGELKTTTIEAVRFVPLIAGELM